MAEDSATQEIIDCATAFGFRTNRGADISLPALLAEMSKHKVKRACTISTTGIFLDFELGNEQTLAACRENAALIPMVTVDPRRYAGCEEAVQKSAAEGCKLFALFPDTQRWMADSPGASSLASAVAAAGGVLSIEASTPGGPTRVLRAAGDAGLSIILTGVDHVNMGEAVSVAKAHGRIHFCTWSLSSVGTLETIAEQVGVERLVFGSGSAVNYFSSAYLRVNYGGFGADEKHAIFSANMRRILGEGA
jgi:predicted TIM-barrel fold metal-dependent hydrolase